MGAVTAETAVVLPVLIAFTTTCVWMLSVGIAQVRTVDAAREAARAAARGDDPSAAIAVAERIAPEGIRVQVQIGEKEVVATASGRLRGPAGLLGRLPQPRLRAESTAVVERRVG